ncbi:MAG: ABC transporter permease, partial [Bacteroidota bacterium]|nr:ABC transporter permease [Bacteroidota bacterium]
MLQNYFKIGIRNLLLHKSYSLINIIGLAAGITCCLFIVLYIHDELNYDRYHERADRIHRVTMDNWAKQSPAMAPAIKASYPHLAEEAVRLWPLYAPAKLRHEDKVFVESGGVFADAGVFSVFTWPMIAGNPGKALTASNSIVLTESMARKYFGTSDAMGKHMEFWGNDVTVTGVVQDVPMNSHLRFDFLISFHTLYNIMGKDLDDNWGMPAFYTYVLARPGVSSDDIQRASSEIYSSHQVTVAGSPRIQPLTSVHLHSNLPGEFAPGGNVGHLFTLGSAALIVLLLACINFTNLTTARAATRTKEVGMRKVMGARRGQLIGQFFGEALLMTVAAFLIAVMLVNLLMPAFNHIAGKDIDIYHLRDPLLVSGLFVLMLLIGLVAGGYPALYLSKFRPMAVLKGSGNLRVTNLLIRKGLIVFQFAVSTVFMVGMAVVLLQLDYLQKKDLGFQKEAVLVLDGDNFPQMRDALKGVAGVEVVAGVPQLLGARLPASPYKASGVYTDSLSQMFNFGVTEAFIETMGMQIVSGRSFNEGSESDLKSAFVLNESAIRELGWSSAEAIGKSFSVLVPPLEGGNEIWREGTVIGVVRDFHHNALYEHIEPLVLYPSYDLNFTLVRMNGIDPQRLNAIGAVWSKVNPEAPYNYFFLDDYLAQKYEAEEKLGNIMGAATVLAILIASLGLFGLVAFSAGQRTKEIG